MCFVFIWEQTATCTTYSIYRLIFITEVKSVYRSVRTGSLNKAVCAYFLKGWLSSIRVCGNHLSSGVLSPVFSIPNTGYLNSLKLILERSWQEKYMQVLRFAHRKLRPSLLSDILLPNLIVIKPCIRNKVIHVEPLINNSLNLKKNYRINDKIIFFHTCFDLSR